MWRFSDYSAAPHLRIKHKLWFLKLTFAWPVFYETLPIVATGRQTANRRLVIRLWLVRLLLKTLTRRLFQRQVGSSLIRWFYLMLLYIVFTIYVANWYCNRRPVNRSARTGVWLVQGAPVLWETAVEDSLPTRYQTVHWRFRRRASSRPGSCKPRLDHPREPLPQVSLYLYTGFLCCVTIV